MTEVVPEVVDVDVISAPVQVDVTPRPIQIAVQTRSSGVEVVPRETAEVVPQVREITITSRGLQGRPGEDGQDGQDGATGPPGNDGGFYLHDQGPASAAWYVLHNLGRYPSVSVLDSTKREMGAVIEHESLNALWVILENESGGYASCT